MFSYSNFDEDHIIFTTGDFRQRKLPQDKNSQYGKTLKISKVDSSYEILSIGHRNAQGISKVDENLFLSTALLPMFDLIKYPKNYGKNTKEALASGFFWGYEGLINNIISKILKKNGKKFKIILTGGYSYLFKKHLYKKAKIEKDITMHGIIKIYRNFII